MDRPALLAAVVGASVACSGSSSTAPSIRDASTASGADSSSGAGDADGAAAAGDADGAQNMGDDLDGAVADASTVGAYDGPVSDAACPGLPASGTWQNVSPPGSNYTKTYTGLVSVAVRTDDPAIVYAGADSNGIFKSTDCGRTWALVSTGKNGAAMSSGRPWSLVIDPVVPDVMYVVQGYGAGGLWKSTNAGVDWDQVLTPDVLSAFRGLSSISLDPTDHTHIVVAAHGGGDSDAGMCGTYSCVAESTNSGATWRLPAPIPIPWGEGSGVAIVDRKTWVHTQYDHIWYTTDEGTSWVDITLPANIGAAPNTNYYASLVWQAPGGRYLIPAQTQSGPPGIFESKPGDVSSWTPIPGSPQGQLLMPTGKNIVVAGTLSAAYAIASQSDVTTWTTFPGPPLASPPSGSLGAIPEGTAYDSVHHVLYVTTDTTGMWRTVVE